MLPSSTLAAVIQAAEPVAPRPAADDEPRSFWTISPYVLVSNPTASAQHVGIGGEVSLMWHGAPTYESLFCFPHCVGVLAQAESLPSVRSPGERVGRVAVAGQAALGPFGLELGPALESTPGGGPLVGVHTGLFFSVGFASMAFRLTGYPARFGEHDGGIEAAFVVRETIPLALPLVYVPKSGDVSPAFFTHALGRFPM